MFNSSFARARRARRRKKIRLVHFDLTVDSPGTENWEYLGFTFIIPPNIVELVDNPVDQPGIANLISYSDRQKIFSFTPHFLFSRPRPFCVFSLDVAPVYHDYMTVTCIGTRMDDSEVEKSFLVDASKPVTITLGLVFSGLKEFHVRETNDMTLQNNKIIHPDVPVDPVPPSTIAVTNIMMKLLEENFFEDSSETNLFLTK